MIALSWLESEKLEILTNNTYNPGRHEYRCSCNADGCFEWEIFRADVAFLQRYTRKQDTNAVIVSRIPACRSHFTSNTAGKSNGAM